MATLFIEESITNARFVLEVPTSDKGDNVLSIKIEDKQECTSNSVEVSKKSVGDLIKHLQKQYSKMED